MKRVAIAIALLAVAGAGFYWLSHRDETSPATPQTPVAVNDPASPSSSPPGAEGSEALPSKEEVPVVKTMTADDVVQSHTSFAIDLHRILASKNEIANLFFSPYSISTILDLTAAGASGKTLDEMNKVLNISRGATVHAGIAELNRQLLSTSGGTRPYEFAVANSLWGTSTYPMLPSFTALAEKYYDTAGVYRVDYRANPQAARARINQWVEDQTMSHIKELVPQDAITAYTALVLANAVYFKGDWKQPFDTRLTRDDVFHAPGASDIPMTLMRASGTWRYFEDDDAQVVSLPIASSGTAVDPTMLVLLPRQDDGLANIEKNLTAESFAKWFDKLESRSGQVFLPRFSMTVSISLKDPLKDMGMVDAFDKEKADFRNLLAIPSGDNVYISGAYHKAFIDVNEKGLEAAAGTAVAMAGAGPAPTNPFIFRADHPFLFAIRLEPSKEILFLGRMTLPPPPVIAEVTNARGERGRGQGGATGERGRGERRGRSGQGTTVAAFQDPANAARSALDLVRATRQDSNFVSPEIHTGLWQNLAQVEASANAVLTEDKNNQAAYTSALNSFATSLTQTINRSGEIGGRRGETPINRDKALALQAKLRDIQNQ
jgi:serpin B